MGIIPLEARLKMGKLLNQFGDPYVVNRPDNHRTTNALVNSSPFGPNYYDGAWPGAIRGEFSFQMPLDFNTEASFDRQLLAVHARDLHKNSFIISAIVEKIITYTVGLGMKAHSQAEKDRDIYDQYWEEWSNEVTHDGKDFDFVQTCALRSMIVDGDCGVLKLRGEGGIPMLQLIESHRIGNCMTAPSKNNAEYGGVEFKRSTGEIVRYWIKSDFTGEADPAGGANSRSVKPRNFALVFMPTRVAQFRGMSHLAPCILDAIDIADVLDAAKLGIRLRETIPAVVTRDPGVASGEDQAPLMTDGSGGYVQPTAAGVNSRFGEAVLRTNQSRYKTMEKLTIPVVQPGEKWEDLQNNRPNESFIKFLDFVVRGICNTFGISYEFAIDPGKLHGTATRQILRDAESLFVKYAKVINQKINCPFWNFVIGDGIARGLLPPHPDYQKVHFRMPVAPSVDVGRESAAMLSELGAGIRTMEGIATENGKEWHDQIYQKRLEADYIAGQAQELADKRNIDFSLALQMISSFGGEVDTASIMEKEDDAKRQNDFKNE